MSFHKQSRKSKAWFDDTPAAVKQQTSDVQYGDLDGSAPASTGRARDVDLRDDTVVLEKDLKRLVPETVNDPKLRTLLFGENPTEESVAERIEAIRDLVLRFLQIRLRPGYAQGMHMIVALLLAKMRPEKALWCFVSIVEDVMPIDFYSKPPAAMQGFRVETELIVRLSVLMFPEMNSFGEKVDDSNLSVAVRMLAAKVLVPLFVDACSLEVTEAIWDRLLAGSDSASFIVTDSGIDTSSGAAGAAILIHVILGIVTAARPHMNEDMRSTTIYQLLLDTVDGLTVETLPLILGQVDAAFLHPNVIKKYRVKARQHLSARWIDNPGRLRKMVRRDDIHFGLDLLEKLRQSFRDATNNTGELNEAMLRKVLRRAVEQGLEMPLPLDMFCQGVVRLHETTDAGLAVLQEQRQADSVIGLNFRELVSVLSIALRGTFAQKLRLCFDIFNTNSSGYLKLDEADRMIRAILRVPSEEEERIARQTDYVPPSFDDRHAHGFFPQMRKEAESAGKADESSHARQLKACAVRCKESLRDIAESNSSAEFQSEEKKAQSFHTASCFVFAEVYDVVKDEPLIQNAIGGVDEELADPDAQFQNRSLRKIASDSIVVRSVKAATPHARSKPTTIGHDEQSFQRVDDAGLDTALLHRDRNQGSVHARQPAAVAKGKDCCVLL